MLVLGHADADRRELAQPACAAQLAAALADAIQQLGFVAYANLAHLDARAKDAGQVADQPAEVYTDSDEK